MRICSHEKIQITNGGLKFVYQYQAEGFKLCAAISDCLENTF